MDIKDLYCIFQEHKEITTDSRNCPAGSIFFALKGETFNGNEYASKALEAGCSYAVVDEKEYADKNDSRYILVEDSLHALQQLANYHRRQLGTRIIGVTGTNGKTTTKELIAAVLSKKYDVLYTQGNFNNHIGVPKTLLRLERHHEIAVVEMGANHPGEIKTLVNIAEPDYGIITNVAKAHLLGFGSFEGVIKTKGELYDFLRNKKGTEKSVVFINNDNPHLMGISDGLQLIRYGQYPAPQLHTQGSLISCDPFLKFSWNNHEVSTKLVGGYNIDNALAAITIGGFFGVNERDICEALEEYTPSNNRSQFKRTADNALIIDAYNANPTSMAAAIENFRAMHSANKMCVIGKMGELGNSSHEEHVNIVKKLKECNLEKVWLVGKEFCEVFSTAAIALPENFRLFNDVNEVKNTIAEDKPHGMTILIKGSNSTRLFELPDML